MMLSRKRKKKKDDRYTEVGFMNKQKELIMERSGGTCEYCSSPPRLVHHKDFSKTNHRLDNLEPLCYGCHVALHRGKSIILWMKRYMNPQCPNCGRGERGIIYRTMTNTFRCMGCNYTKKPIHFQKSFSRRR